MKAIEHISLLDIKDKKVLLCLSSGKIKWHLPGGKRDLGETDEQVLIRECKEEIGVDLIVDSIKFYDEIVGGAIGKDDGVNVRIKIYTAKFEGDVIPQNEVVEARYFSFEEVPDTSKLGWEYLSKLKLEGLIV